MYDPTDQICRAQAAKHQHVNYTRYRQDKDSLHQVRSRFYSNKARSLTPVRSRLEVTRLPTTHQYFPRLPWIIRQGSRPFRIQPQLLRHPDRTPDPDPTRHIISLLPVREDVQSLDDLERDEPEFTDLAVDPVG